MGQPTQRATNYKARSNIDTAQIFLHANGQRPKRATIRQRSRRRQRRGEPHTEHGLGVVLARSYSETPVWSKSRFDGVPSAEVYHAELYAPMLWWVRGVIGGTIAPTLRSEEPPLDNLASVRCSYVYMYIYVYMYMYIYMYICMNVYLCVIIYFSVYIYVYDDRADTAVEGAAAG